MIWTDEMDARLAELSSGAGASARKIAEALSQEFGANVTRNSVIGRWGRTGIPRPPGPPRYANEAERAAAQPKYVRPVPKPQPHCALFPPPSAETITRLLDRAPRQCPYPLWADGGFPDFFVCGGERDGDRPYCEAHMARTHYRRPERERRIAPGKVAFRAVTGLRNFDAGV